LCGIDRGGKDDETRFFDGGGDRGDFADIQEYYTEKGMEREDRLSLKEKGEAAIFYRN